MILDYYNIEYRIKGKTILLDKNFSMNKIVNAIKSCNNPEIVKVTLQKQFPKYDLYNLKQNELENIASYYSRNIEFNGTVNYLNVLEYLYYIKYRDLTKVI